MKKRVTIEGKELTLHGLRFTVVGTAKIEIPFFGETFTDVTYCRFPVQGVSQLAPDGTASDEEKDSGRAFVAMLKETASDGFLDGMRDAMAKDQELAFLVNDLDLDGEEE